MPLAYGYAWMGVSAVLLVLTLYIVAARGLLRGKPLCVLTVSLALAWWLRVETYLLLIQILPFDTLQSLFLLGATVFGTILLIAYLFLILALINLIFPRTLRAADIFFMACFGGFGVSLVTMLYSVVKLAGKEFGLL